MKKEPFLFWLTFLSLFIAASATANIAQQFGVASQGSTYGSSVASYAIDGDENTYHHTKCNAENNWWQVKLPEPSHISRLVVKNRPTWQSRLNGSTIYIASTPYLTPLDESKKVATLDGSDTQEFTFPTPKVGHYVIIKGNGDNCLHMRELEVYGSIPEAPVFHEHETHYLIPQNSATGYTITTLPASDWQGDTLNYSIVGNVPFAIDTQGILTVNSPLTPNTNYVFDVILSDGSNQVSTSITIHTTSATAVDNALQSGTVDGVTARELINAALLELESKRGTPSLLTAMYGTDPISYSPGNRTQLINIKESVENVFPIVIGNKGRTLAMAGTTANTRYAAYGMSPTELFQDGESLDYVAPFNRLLAWLLAGDPVNTANLAGNKNIALSFANSDRGNIIAWIASEHPSWTITECNDVADLVNCYNTVDLIITGWQGANNNDSTTIKQALKTVMDAGRPVLYVHTWYEAYNDVAHSIADLLNFSLPYGGNYWADDAANWTNVTAMQDAIWNDAGLGSIETMLQHLRDEDYTFDWSNCDDNNSCNAGSPQDSEFLKGAAKVRSIMTSLDTNKRNLFSESSLRLEKLLALIGDHFRQDVSYPMDKENTDDNTFMKSLYADHAVYNYRLLNPAQADMGNFSRSDFSHITPTTRTVNLTSKKNFRSTGAYAIPGQTFKVTRNDHSDLTVKVFINTLRSGATHLYEENGYTRPKYLQSPYFEIAPNETLQLTSPYGGPIQLSFSTNDLPVEVTFENVGEHAYRTSSADDASFAAKLDAGEFDWAEIVTTGFEVHSTLEKMRESMADEKWGSAQALATGTERYMSNFPHVLAGFKGPSIDIVPEIHDFATAKGWTIDNLDLVKHMNADQALCGYGCSGNPYDAYWAYDPIGHGDVHELGHGLERSRFQFSNWEGHSQTNPYSYYTKSKYHETTGGDPSCQNLPFETAFNALQNSIGQADVENFMKTNYWDNSNWSHQVMMTIQTMMTTQKIGKLENGWHLLARLHIHDREFRRADNNDTDWEAKKDSLGFSDYTRAEAIATSNNDYMLMALSTVAELDFRSYLKMWGISYSEKAADQVASYGYTSVPKEFFISAPDGYCKARQNGDFLAKATLAIDGTQTWPASTDTDSDGYWDALDNCPNTANADQKDTDKDGLGNACDSTPNGDSDADGVDNLSDNCPAISNIDQLNTDDDSQGNACDSDDDNDNVLDDADVFPLDAFESADFDNDGTGNNADLDDDNDQIPDVWESANGFNPFDASDASTDNDHDGVNNVNEYLNNSDPNEPYFTWDIDGSGSVQPLSDGILVLRYLFGFTGETLINSAIDPNATRTTATDIESYIQGAIKDVDIDDNGEANPLSDGILLLRYLFNFSGDNLIHNAVEQNGQRKTATDIENYIQRHMP